MRYLTGTFARGALRRGRSIEQFLGAVRDADVPGVRWVEIRPISAGYAVVLHTVEDVGSETFCDLVEFPPLVPGDEEDFGLALAQVDDETAAMAAAGQPAGAVDDKWVNAGVAGDE